MTLCGDNVNAASGECIEISRQCGDKCFAFAGCHFGDFAKVQSHAANELHIERNHFPLQRMIADDLIRRASQLSSARVTFIEEASLLEPVGGVGALLRYRISPDTAAPYEQAGVISKSEALSER